MKTNITLFLFGVMLICSCQKEKLQTSSTWNALAFTQSQSGEYHHYMNEPHINISFPSRTEKKLITYKEGEWRDKNSIYVLTAHNWGDNEIILHIYKENNLFDQITLKPEPTNSNQNKISLKNFSMSFQPTPGEYSFKVLVKDSRGITPLTLYPLHGSENKMVVY